MIGKIRKIYAERKRQTLALAVILSAFAAVALALFLFGGEKQGILGEKKPRGSIKILRGVDLAREKWRIEGEKRLGMIETEQREIRKELETISTALGALEKKSSEPYPYPPAEIRDETSPETQFPPASPLPGAATLPPEPPKTQTPIRVFAPLGGSPAEGPVAEPALLNWIPSGSFVPGTLVSGLDAPTGTASSRNPHPVLIHLVETSRLPSFRRMNIARCHVTGAGYGQLASERAYIRLERIACVLRSGDVIDNKIKGYVAGEDGKTGIRGRLVSKQGKILSRGILAGFASGFGGAVESSNATAGVVAGGTFTTVRRRSSRDLVKTGIGGGTGEAGTLLAEYYLKLAEEVFPVIEIDAGRRVDVIITEGTELPPRKTSYGETG
ncbi:MAG: hypothetical protein F4Y78_04500 [Candidatus Dadabacteria bacterium]|nr:hypothetical protein [Candidatus Dadabacteria bacterium]MYA48764.1 hypothetical protein [Candidatus Dadabacteria bacterium]MYF47756.1 hypothetical protein [Candidatus Dadabacteria bacterium]MYG82507.1 hypothetical protein [Candidatus Dadabacteria bacterium]MYK50051.1 hypothetical protein [Candidatus Dadabacteria bacterium]